MSERYVEKQLPPYRPGCCGLWPVHSSYRQLIVVHECRVPSSRYGWWVRESSSHSLVRRPRSETSWCPHSTGDQGYPPTLTEQTYFEVRPSLGFEQWVLIRPWHGPGESFLPTNRFPGIGVHVRTPLELQSGKLRKDQSGFQSRRIWCPGIKIRSVVTSLLLFITIVWTRISTNRKYRMYLLMLNILLPCLSFTQQTQLSFPTTTHLLDLGVRGGTLQVSPLVYLYSHSPS